MYGKQAFLSILSRYYKNAYIVAEDAIFLGKELNIITKNGTIASTTSNDTEIATSIVMQNMTYIQRQTVTIGAGFSTAWGMNAFLLHLLSFTVQYFLAPCFLFCLACHLWELRFINLRDRSCSLPLPGGKMGFPLVGENFHFLFSGANHHRCRRKKYGNIYKTHLFGSPTIIAIGEENVRPILLGEGQLVETRWPSTTRRILGENGIVNGDKHTHQRIKRLVLRAFSPKYMGIYAPMMQSGIANHVEQWRSIGEISVLEACKQMVSKTMMTILLGIDPEDPDIQLYIQAADDVISSIFSLPLNLPGFAFRKGLRAQKFVFDRLEAALRSRIDESDDSPMNECTEENQSVLLMILKLARQEGNTKITLRNLQNLSLEFIFAGTQSLQCASSSMIVHLSRNPEIVRRLQEEIKRHDLWNKPMQEVSYEDIQSLQFADCVVKETMRVTPTIPGAVRVAAKTFKLGGYQVPKGWQILYNIKITHETVAGKILQNGPNCEFNPDEFFNCPSCLKKEETKKCDAASENGPTAQSNMKQNKKETMKNTKTNHMHKCSNTASAFSYIPFGKGVRMCAGKNYGLLFLKVLVFELVRTTQFRLVGKVKFNEIPMTRPHKSVKIEFKPLKKN